MKPGMPCASTMPTMPPMPPRNLAMPCNNTNAPNATRRINLPRSFWVFWFITPPVDIPAAEHMRRRALLSRPFEGGGLTCPRGATSAQRQLQRPAIPVEQHAIRHDVRHHHRPQVVADVQARAIDDHEALRRHLVPHVH